MNQLRRSKTLINRKVTKIISLPDDENSSLLEIAKPNSNTIKQKQVVRILSLDGGGIRGVTLARILQAIEN